MACTKEEIERKRLAALQKRQNKAGDLNNSMSSPVSCSSPRTPLGQSRAGPVRNFGNFSSSGKSYHPYAKSESKVQESSVPVTKVVSGTIYLISEERFEVNPSEFCTPLINVFKTIPSRNYDPSSKLWNFSIDDYQELISKVAPLAPHIVLGPLPPYVLKILRSETTNPQSIDLTPIEATLRHKLMPFQQDGVRFGIANRGRCMIADDMGLGKTFQALAIASYYRHNFPLLIVTTSSMRETWQSKIYELLPCIPMMNIVTLSTSKDAQLVADRQTEVVIVSYKITTMHTDLLKNKKFGVIIIDESHYLKSHKAQCTVALRGIAKQSMRIILLSGTPALSRPAELFTQLELIEPRLFGSYTEYGKRYCAGKQTNFGWDMTGQSNLAELQIILQKRFLIRRTKEQVLTCLEGKTRESVLLDETLLEFSKEDRKELTQMAEAYKSKSSTERHAALLSFFSESARVKIPAVCVFDQCVLPVMTYGSETWALTMGLIRKLKVTQRAMERAMLGVSLRDRIRNERIKYVRQLLSGSNEKFLVFAHHRNVIDALCLTLDTAGVHYICIVGSTPAHTRADLVDKFQFVESCRCAVLSITAANSGITLTAARLVLFAELHWNPGILTQAEARAHRIGQQGGVCARYLLARGTCDDYMWPMLQGKLNVLNNVGLSGDSFEGTATKHQESKTNISQYLSPNSLKNKNDYIPGTNIRKDGATSRSGDDVDKSFLEDDEGDELLAAMDL